MLMSSDALGAPSPVEPVRRFLAFVTVAMIAASSGASIGVPFLELLRKESNERRKDHAEADDNNKEAC